MDAGPHEVELKFALEPQMAPTLRVHLSGDAAVKARTLAATYFDTPDQALRRAGLTLRVRREGEVWRQTVKTLAGGPCRGEWQASVAGPLPEPDRLAATPVGAVLNGQALLPLFAIKVRRRSINTTEAEARVEASLDEGKAEAPTGTARFGELELELKSGEPASLFALAARLRRQFRLRPSFVAKAERGFALLDAPAPPRRHWRAPALSAAMSAGSAFQLLALAGLEQIADNAGQLALGEDPEIVHQLRVGVRRLRSAMKAFAPVIADSRRAALARELEWLAGELDEARDLDVLLAGPMRKPGAGSRRLRERLLADRARAYERARSAAQSDRLSALLFDFLAWVQVGPWTTAAAAGAALRQETLAILAAGALDKARAQVRKRARGFANLSRRKRHKLRIAAKRLRYAAEDLRGVYPDRAKSADHFIDRLKELLDCLGALNDIAAAEALLRPHRPHAVVGQALKKRQTRLLDRAAKALKKFQGARRFWPG